MPSEVRQLLFRPVEVVRALKDYFRAVGRELPAGEVVACAPEPDGAGEIRVRMTVALQSNTMALAGNEDILVGGSMLVAALILFCKARGVPLPASASKSLTSFHDQTCLIVRINPKRDPTLDQMIRGQAAA